MESPLLNGLNAAQCAAVTSAASVLQILAPPGSGKTKTLTSRVAFLLTHYAYQPQNVICCTFTVKASNEMKARLQGLIGYELAEKLILGTFHSVCRRYLLAYGNLIDIPRTFGIADSSDSASIVKKIIKRLGLNFEPKTARARISSHKAKGKTLRDLEQSTAKSLEKQDFVTLFEEYEAELRTSNLLDYDDLLIRCVDLLKAYPNCVANIDALLIDEFQDTNVIQFELMKLLASGKRQITIVGDPDQSIYGFRSAEIENLRRMKRFYPETVVINLEENYRSSSAVLELAQEVIEQDTNRPSKKLKATHRHCAVPVLRRLPNPHEEAKWITAEIKRMQALTGGILQYHDFAILLRSAYLSLLIEKSFTQAKLPYRMVGGHRFFDRVEIRLLVDYLRVISHPENNPAIVAIVNTPSRKIGEATISEFVRLADSKDLSLWVVVQKIVGGNLIVESKLSRPAEQNLSRFTKLIQSARKMIPTFSPPEVPRRLIEYLVESLNYKSYLKTKYKDDWEERLENVEELITHASDFALQPMNEERLPDLGMAQQQMDKGDEVLSQFLANIVLSTEVEKKDEKDKSRITISTIHSAKGLEWPVVFIPAIYDGSIPHSRAEDTDEERRLLYVAMTRAQALLTMTFPVMQSREQGESKMTPFLPESVLTKTARVGPVINDKRVEDIASILRRPCPTAAELVNSLNLFEEGSSHYDDVWPADGTHRKDLAPTNRQLTSALSAATINPEHLGVLQQPGTRYHNQSFTTTTTMNNTSSFSISSTSLGFTSASYQLKTMPQPSSQTTTQYSTEIRPDLKKNHSAIKSEKGKISNFFSAGTSQSQDSQSRLHQSPQQVQPYTLPTINRSHSNLEPSVPQGFLRQRSTLAGSITHKRPRAVLEERDPNPKSKYVFLSSSPKKEDADENKSSEDVSTATPPIPGLRKSLSDTTSLLDTRSILRPSMPKALSFSTSMARSQVDQSSVSNVLSSKPLATAVSRSGGTSVNRPTGLSNIASKERKTLGVRRSMNGWTDRMKR